MNQLDIIKEELEDCYDLWSRFSCDCLHYYMLYLEKRKRQLEIINN